MARPRRPDEPASYQGKPNVPPELTARYDLVTKVLGGQITTSAAAEQLGIARVNMQTLVHRAEQAVLEALTPRPSGPTPKPAVQAALEAEVKQLRAKVHKLEEQLTSMDLMLGAAGEIIRNLRGLPPRRSTGSSRTSKTAAKPATPSSDEDPEPPAAIAATLARVTTMREHATHAARVLGVGTATLRRWLARLVDRTPLVRRRGGRRAPVSAQTAAAVRGHVRALGGLVGAASLAHTIAGISRRAAADLKADELAAIERERRAECARVAITVPGVIRGFDAMYVGDRFALIAADAAIPYRTSAAAATAYDSAHVAEALAQDFAAHGAPLALRLDRARCHETADVLSLLEAHGVLILHGPPRHPQYYGQLERQNREHRAWLFTRTLDDGTLQVELEAMRLALNRLWHRRTLDWETAEQRWLRRPTITDDRHRLHDEVHEQAAWLRADHVEPSLAMRLAIEQALMQRGYLRLIPGRTVLCD